MVLFELKKNLHQTYRFLIFFALQKEYLIAAKTLIRILFCEEGFLRIASTTNYDDNLKIAENKQFFLIIFFSVSTNSEFATVNYA